MKSLALIDEIVGNAVDPAQKPYPHMQVWLCMYIKTFEQNYNYTEHGTMGMGKGF